MGQLGQTRADRQRARAGVTALAALLEITVPHRFSSIVRARQLGSSKPHSRLASKALDMKLQMNRLEHAL
jgi:hypothetical protein